MDYATAYGCIMCMMGAAGLAIGGPHLRSALGMFMASWVVSNLVQVGGWHVWPCRALDGAFLAVVLVSWAMQPRWWKVVLAASLGLQFAVYGWRVHPYYVACALNALWLVQAGALGWCVVSDAREATRPVPLNAGV